MGMTKERKCILCADDVKDNRTAAVALLHATGFEVENARGIADALRLTRREKFDLYLVPYR